MSLLKRQELIDWFINVPNSDGLLLAVLVEEHPHFPDISNLIIQVLESDQVYRDPAAAVRRVANKVDLPQTRVWSEVTNSVRDLRSKYLPEPSNYSSLATRARVSESSLQRLVKALDEEGLLGPPTKPMNVGRGNPRRIFSIAEAELIAGVVAHKHISENIHMTRPGDYLTIAESEMPVSGGKYVEQWRREIKRLDRKGGLDKPVYVLEGFAKSRILGAADRLKLKRIFSRKEKKRAALPSSVPEGAMTAKDVAAWGDLSVKSVRTYAIALDDAGMLSAPQFALIGLDEVRYFEGEDLESLQGVIVHKVLAMKPKVPKGGLTMRDLISETGYGNKQLRNFIRLLEADGGLGEPKHAKTKAGRKARYFIGEDKTVILGTVAHKLGL